MTETPCVIVDVQRSGPSTGQPTEPSQGDVLQARWGTHGDHEVIVLSPSSVQETLDMTIKSFNLADKYRVPVILLMDGYVAHMREKLIIPDKIEKYERLKIIDDNGKPTEVGVTRPSKVHVLEYFGGNDSKMYLTGLTHDDTGLPVTSNSEIHSNLVKRLHEKIWDNVDDITMIEEKFMDDAEIAVVSFGITARPSLSSVIKARREGIKAGHIKLMTLFPHAQKELSRLSEKVDKIIVPEMNLGQYYWVVRASVKGNCEVVSLPKIGGEIHTPYEILNEIKRR